MTELLEQLPSFTGDSFFTLSILGRIGLVVLSLVLLMVLVACVCWIARRFGFGAAAVALVPMYWLFNWCTPQIYYLYYIVIFDGLPWQWVIGAPPAALHFGGLLSFQVRGNLSEISQGAAFWIVLAVGFWCARRREAASG